MPPHRVSSRSRTTSFFAAPAEAAQRGPDVARGLGEDLAREKPTLPRYQSFELVAARPRREPARRVEHEAVGRRLERLGEAEVHRRDGASDPAVAHVDHPEPALVRRQRPAGDEDRAGRRREDVRRERVDLTQDHVEVGTARPGGGAQRQATYARAASTPARSRGPSAWSVWSVWMTWSNGATSALMTGPRGSSVFKRAREIRSREVGHDDAACVVPRVEQAPGRWLALRRFCATTRAGTPPATTPAGSDVSTTLPAVTTVPSPMADAPGHMDARGEPHASPITTGAFASSAITTWGPMETREPIVTRFSTRRCRSRS